MRSDPAPRLERLWGRLGRLGPRSRYALLSFLGQGVVYAATLATALIIARELGPEGKGEYTALTLVTLFASLVLAGTISTGMGRAYLSGERASLARSSLRHGAIAFAASWLIAIPAMLAGLEPLAAICFIVVAAPANVIVLDLLVVFQAGKQPIRYQGLRALKAGVMGAGLLVVVLAASPDTRDWAYILWAAGMVVAAVVGVLLVARSEGSLPSGSLRGLARRGRGSMTTNLSDWMLLRIDAFIVLPIAGAFQLGLYSVAVNFAEVALLAGQSVGLAAFEDQRTLDRSAERRLLRKTARLGVLVTTVAVVAGLLLVEPLFGSDFADARLPLLLLAPGIAARAVGFVCQQVLLARGHGRPLAKRMFFTLTVSVVLAVVGTATMGIEGAAIAASLSYVLYALLLLRLLRSSGTEVLQPSTAPGPTTAGG